MKRINYEKFRGLRKGTRNKSDTILKLLEENPMRTIEIAKRLNIDPKSMDYHFRKIRDIIEYRRMGRYIYWGLKSKLNDEE